VFLYAGFIYRTLSLEGVVSLPPSQSAAIAEKLNEMFAPNQSQYAHQSYVINLFNGSLWTIRYEFWCYIAIFMMGVMGLVKRKGIVFLVFALVVTVFYWRYIIKILLLDFATTGPYGTGNLRIFIATVLVSKDNRFLHALAQIGHLLLQVLYTIYTKTIFQYQYGFLLLLSAY
jgi:hypothetical protein